MKALLAALLFAFCLLCPCAHAQQDEARRSQFLAREAKAKQGDANAQYNLGGSYYFGAGVAKDYVEAVKWIRKAAEQGLALAQYDLGVCYKIGKGVEKDYVEAYAWCNLASATNKFAGKTRDDLEKEMSPQQIADAQKRTRELRAIVEAKAAK